ncbi:MULTISPECIES: thiamine pyrophosphate-dependent enzyme [Clostridium]|jgi:2-oxoglutarate/2-oxoacid ferredoxin oxidoreductase subunit beta|uniref:thiamine pyrophosphate-dependent enzyme n=1 Tax=Clostridium TaxID=1485 RepID=UPI001DFAFC15|nr:MULTISPECIES: thiamine pyrophosphate-dependent enzyme [Clostridium]MBS5307910.1 2-oxoglutarate oxidoreductase [Clostridium sp.]MDU1279504.1 thiamine pyrophosphate-dependent enzyme [Clostridium sp.]MDU1568326.1 thiamine pyrophosphate-dependent enzyme [Clostridium sp.]MDU2681228.1 thiamine pyrophosphate-dependent enzyme [Clostridium sp.]MDU3349459.1 thiamine pyrophosphate-dependent enzyme [Clostridium sp.]
MGIVYQPTKVLLDVPTHYCPGCTHGIIHKLVGEVIEELGILDKTIGVASVGCSVLAYDYFACDMFQAAHGRAPAVATGIKRANPDKAVFTYQGDGDLIAIGTGEVVHAAARGENIVTIFVNNCIYGMTGGQMAPTSLEGQITETSPYGRDVKVQGYPIRVSEMISTLDGACYVERVSVDNIANLTKAKKAIKKAFDNSIKGLGYSFIEVLSTCPTNWGLSPIDSLKWLRENMIPYYPLGVKKDLKKEDN